MRFVLLFLALAVSGLVAEERPPVLAHYMPWYASKPVSGKWGWHWTMNHYDPDVIRWDGRREAASHDYPLIGLYDSFDPDVLECQVLLMKFAGIDGVIIDWYGTKDFLDYGWIHRNTEALLPYLGKADLKFAICYEDQSIGVEVDTGRLLAERAVEAGRKPLGWVAENWFSRENYLRIGDQPALLVFGPQYFSGEQWKAVTAELNPSPKVFALPHLAEKAGAAGPFGWPPVNQGKRVNPADWKQALEKLYARQGEGESVGGVIFPGFRDIYAQAGVRDSYGSIDDRNGATFREALDLALGNESDFIQIATWNDYGEGTVIEPTRNLGYRYLEELQAHCGSGKYQAEDLRLPVLLHRIRKGLEDDSDAKDKIEEASALLFESRCDDARTLLATLQERLEQDRPAFFPEQPAAADSKYRLFTGIPYREGEDLSEYEKNRCRLDVYCPAPPRGTDELVAESAGKVLKTVVWFHGGGISKGHRSIPVPLREKGVAVVSANYRLSPRVESPDYLEDAAAAVAWTIRNIEKYGGSPDSVFVSGHSAGGYLAAMVGLDKKYLAAHDIDADSLAGVIPFSGHTITHFTVRKERGISGNQPIIDQLAPLFHVRKTAPPMLLITGDRELELWGRYEENAYFWRMMEVVGHPDCQLRELEGFDHGKMPEPAFPLLLRFMEPRGE